jgi:hypothetical protein
MFLEFLRLYNFKISHPTVRQHLVIMILGIVSFFSDMFKIIKKEHIQTIGIYVFILFG